MSASPANDDFPPIDWAMLKGVSWGMLGIAVMLTLLDAVWGLRSPVLAAWLIWGVPYSLYRVARLVGDWLHSLDHERA